MNTQMINNWVAAEPSKLPDFIIGGAMKCGTTTLHKILNSHPDVAIAKEEIGYFDLDSLTQHPDYHFFDSKANKWYSPTINTAPKDLWKWYFDHFPDRKSEKIIGEDSTTYLASDLAAKRIGLQEKPIKLIFILRHPTERTISNYLHNLKSGRAIYSFEDTLKYVPDSILKRSLYRSQLESYYHHIDSTRIKVISFESLVNNTEYTIKNISSFLDIDFSKFNSEDLHIHANKTKTPKYLQIQLFRNRFFRPQLFNRYHKRLPDSIENSPSMSLFYRVLEKIHKNINPMNPNNEFVVKKATIELLDTFFKSELEGLDDLIGKPIMKDWFNEN